MLLFGLFAIWFFELYQEETPVQLWSFFFFLLGIISANALYRLAGWLWVRINQKLDEWANV